MSAKSLHLRVPAHLVERIEECMRRAGWDLDHSPALEAATRRLLGAAVEEAELDPTLWLSSDS